MDSINACFLSIETKYRIGYYTERKAMAGFAVCLGSERSFVGRKRKGVALGTDPVFVERMARTVEGVGKWTMVKAVCFSIGHSFGCLGGKNHGTTARAYSDGEE